MSKKEQEQITALETQLNETNAELTKLNALNQQLRQEWLRKEAQIARRKQSCKSINVLRKQFAEYYFNDFRETKIAILEHLRIPENYRSTLTSKRVEQQVFNFGKTVLFKRRINFPEAGKSTMRTENVPIMLPFTGADGYLNIYGDFFVIRPYFANGGGGIQQPLDNLTVNKDCAVFTDFCEYSQTNANTSLSMQAVTQLYANILAEIEVAKIQNRNMLKVPFIFDASEISDNNELVKALKEWAEIVNGVEDNADALFTQYVSNIKLLNTSVVYYGNEFEQAKKDAINALYNYYGIGNIKNENRARKITAEMEHTQDEYNINITKVLQSRTESWRVAAQIYPEFGNIETKVNLTAYNAAQVYLQQLVEGGTQAQEDFDADRNRYTEERTRAEAE